MSEAAEALRPEAAGKDLYEVGEIPPLGHLPSKMYAWSRWSTRRGRTATRWWSW
jgi:crotonyl-CoA carboxylase/reductase